MVPLLIRLLAIIGLLWTGKQVARQVSSTIRPGDRQNDEKSDKVGSDGDMVHDPVCQTYIPKSLAIQKTIHGERVYFCSHACAAKFIAQHQEGVTQ